MPADLRAIFKLQVPVIVQIGRRFMPVGEVASIVPGAIIELPKAADEELELMVNNKQIGRGTAVKVGENFGIRISSLGSLGERVRALGTPVVASAAATAPEPTPAPPVAPPAADETRVAEQMLKN
jgi:flagellar motor switch protein FliN/FliY